MRKIILWLIISQTLFAAKYDFHNWWLIADSAVIYNYQVLANKVKISRCNQIFPSWYLSASEINVKNDILYLKDPALDFFGIRLPVLFSELPLNGDGRSGILPPKTGSDLTRGRYLTLPIYLWFNQNNFAQIFLSHSSKLGLMTTLNNIFRTAVYDLGIWLSSSAQGVSWRLASQGKNNDLAWNMDWSDTDNKDLFWLWRLDSFGVIQGRLERFFKISFKDLVLEFFSPKVLSSQYDKFLLHDYAWLPRLSWEYKQGGLKHWFQYTNFKLNEVLLGDNRPKSVKRLVYLQELNKDFDVFGGNLEASFFMHYLYENNSENINKSLIPWAFFKWHSFINIVDGSTLEPVIAVRLAKYVNQDQQPILDSEVLQSNIATWISPRVYAGNDRISDVNSVVGALNWLFNSGVIAMIGVKHNSGSRVCLTDCQPRPANNELAFGLENLNGISSFLTIEGSRVKNFAASYSRKFFDADVVLGYRKNEEMELSKHWYLDYKRKISDLDFGIEYIFMKVKDEFLHKGSVSLQKNYGCWSWGVNYNWQKLDNKRNLRDIGLKINLFS